MVLYQRFFGFRKAPFELVPDPDFLFLGESHDSALANLVAGIEAGKGFVAITGPVGAGKTTILRALLRRIGRTERLCFLTQPEADVADLLSVILDGFGAPAEGAPLVELRRRIREYLAAGDRPGILILDEAHLLREDVAEQIRLLSNLEEDDRKLLQIVLSGQPELKTLLSTPRLKPLAQRIEMFYEIQALSLEETSAYLARRLQIAAGSPGAEFEELAAREIHVCTGGIPRLINLLAERSLVSAYVAESHVITPDLVAEAFEDLGEVTHAVMPGRPSRRATSKRRAKPKVTERSVTERSVAERSMTGREAMGSEVGPVERSRRPMRFLAGFSLAAVLLLAIASLGSRVGRDSGRAAAADPGVTPGATPVDSGGSPGEAALAPPTSAAPVTKAQVGTAEAAKPPPSGTAAKTAEPSGRWAVHVASLQRLEKAQDLAMRLREETGAPIRILPTELESGVWYRVLVGDYATQEQARAGLETLRTRQEFDFVRTVRLAASAPTSEETP